MYFLFCFFFLLVGATPEAVDGHSQLLRWVLIWPEEPQLVDLVGFAEMGWHDPVPFFDLTSKQSNVGHHSSVVVKAGVKHQGLKGVIRACYRSENPKTEWGESSGPLLCVKSLRFSKKCIWRFLRGDSVNNCLENLFNICSKFGWYLKEVQALTWRQIKSGAEKKNFTQELPLTRMHSSRGISNTFSICDSTLSGSAFLRSIYGRRGNLE